VAITAAAPRTENFIMHVSTGQRFG